jgi:hypothetical protein
MESIWLIREIWRKLCKPAHFSSSARHHFFFGPRPTRPISFSSAPGLEADRVTQSPVPANSRYTRSPPSHRFPIAHSFITIRLTPRHIHSTQRSQVFFPLLARTAPSSPGSAPHPTDAAAVKDRRLKPTQLPLLVR